MSPPARRSVSSRVPRPPSRCVCGVVVQCAYARPRTGPHRRAAVLGVRVCCGAARVPVARWHGSGTRCPPSARVAGAVVSFSQWPRTYIAPLCGAPGGRARAPVFTSLRSPAYRRKRHALATRRPGWVDLADVVQRHRKCVAQPGHHVNGRVVFFSRKKSPP